MRVLGYLLSISASGFMSFIAVVMAALNGMAFFATTAVVFLITYLVCIVVSVKKAEDGNHSGAMGWLLAPPLIGFLIVAGIVFAVEALGIEPFKTPSY